MAGVKKKAKKKPAPVAHIVIGIEGGVYRGASATTKNVCIDCFDWDNEHAADHEYQEEIRELEETIDEMETEGVKEVTVKHLKVALQKMKDEFVPADERWKNLTERMVVVG